MKIVLVTGATGFIGHYLCEALLKKGVHLRVLGRRQPDINAEFHCWDLYGPLSATPLAGVDTVFHLAGKAHALAETRQDKDEYFRVNTEATRKLLEAAKQAGVRSFIYFSSVKAAGDSHGIMDESASVEPDTPYGKSKKASEKLVLGGGYVAHPVVIRPSMVYGNTAKGNLPKMIQAIRSGQFPSLPKVKNRRSMVHVEDIVHAALLTAEHAEAAGQTYIVTDGQAYSTRQMYEWICDALGKSLPNWHVPLLVLRGLGKTGDMIGRVRRKRFMFDSDALHKLMGSALYSSEKIYRDLGFKPQYHLRESLPEIIRFLELHKSQ